MNFVAYSGPFSDYIEFWLTQQLKDMVAVIAMSKGASNDVESDFLSL